MNAYLELHLERNTRWLFWDVALLGQPSQLALQLADFRILTASPNTTLAGCRFHAYSKGGLTQAVAKPPIPDTRVQ